MAGMTPRRLAAILAADVAGLSRLIAEFPSAVRALRCALSLVAR
jgi:hypothetical protein